MDYGVGGAYWNGLQGNMNNLGSYISAPYTSQGQSLYPTTSYPQDQYTPSYNSYPQYPNVGTDTREASLNEADARLEQERQTAIQEGRPDLVSTIDGQIQNIDGAQQQIQGDSYGGYQ
jgi:hypothetical protein